MASQGELGDKSGWETDACCTVPGAKVQSPGGGDGPGRKGGLIRYPGVLSHLSLLERVMLELGVVFVVNLHPQHTDICLFKWKETNLVKMAFLHLCGA